MGTIVISQNVTLDGVGEEPDRRGGLPARRLVSEVGQGHSRGSARLGLEERSAPTRS